MKFILLYIKTTTTKYCLSLPYLYSVQSTPVHIQNLYYRYTTMYRVHNMYYIYKYTTMYRCTCNGTLNCWHPSVTFKCIMTLVPVKHFFVCFEDDLRCRHIILKLKNMLSKQISNNKKKTEPIRTSNLECIIYYSIIYTNRYIPGIYLVYISRSLYTSWMNYYFKLE